MQIAPPMKNILLALSIISTSKQFQEMKNLQKIVSGCKNPFRTFYIAVMHYGVWLLICVPSMALILLVQVQSRVFTAKCSEP